MSEITIDINANLSEDAKRLLKHQELTEQRRLDTIADLYRFTITQLLDYVGGDTDEKVSAEERD